MNSERLNVERSNKGIKKIIAQCCAASGPNLLLLIGGMSSGYVTLLIPKLYRDDAEVHVTADELTWISSINLLINPLGSLVAGPSLDRLGRKPVMYLATVFFLLGWLLLHLWATSAWTLMLAFSLLGLGSGAADPSTHSYLSEIAEVRYRGIMLSTLSLSVSLGSFLQLLVGNYFHWRTCALIDAVVTVVIFVAVFFVPESPQWLAKQGRFPEAKRSLQWLRGWTDSDGAKLEFDSLVTTFSNTSKEASSCWSDVQSLFRRQVVLPCSMLMFTFFIQRVGGINSLTTYLVLVFEKIESPVNEYDAAIITSALQMLAIGILTFFIRRTGKRLPALGSIFVAALALSGISLYTYLREHGIIQRASSHSWIPMTLVLLTIFICSGGISSIPWAMACELFPTEVKGLCMSFVVIVANLLGAVTNKSFLYMLDGLTLPGMFAFYAAVNVLGLVVLYRVMPETEGKSALEIKQMYQKKNGATNVKG